METEAYPDVTLADPDVTLADTADAREDKATVVVLPRQSRCRQSPCPGSRWPVGVATCLILLILAALTAVLVTRYACSDSCCPQCCVQCSNASDCQSAPTRQTSTRSPSLSEVKSKQVYPASSRPGETWPWSNIRLPRSVIPELYDLELKIDLTKFMFYGSVNISIRVNTSTNYIVVHSTNLMVDQTSVSLRSIHSPARRIVRQFKIEERQFHVIETDQPLVEESTYELSVGAFSGRLQARLKGLYLSSYLDMQGERRYLALSQLQAMDARRVFPCFDEPDRKAKFKVAIVHEQGYTALANMPSIGSSTLQNGWRREEFAPTPYMSTYLLAFVVADFSSRNYTFPGGYQLRIWARPEAYNQTEHALDFGIQAYNYFTDYFDTPDVVPKADHVAVPDFPSGAMENWGLVIYRETSLLYDPDLSSTRDKFMVTLIVAHEIAHTWFGNMVTMEWWDDLWLNEGFASLLMYIAMDHAYPEWNVFDIQVVSDILPVMVKDALTTSHPVSSKIRDPEEIHQHFDSISYSKGMAVMRMLRGFAGEEKFRDGLRLYVRRYKFSNAAMADLWTTFSESFNHSMNVALIMDTWTRQMGYPVVSVVSNGSHYRLSQARFLLDPTIDSMDDSPFGYRWYIPFTYSTQSLPNTIQLTWLNLGSVSIPKLDNGWLLGNHDYLGYFRVYYELEMWERFARQLEENHTAIPEANRAGLIGDAFSFSRANMLDYNVALSLTRYLHLEQSFTPWRAFMDAIEFLRGMIANKAAYDQLQHYLRELVGPVYKLSQTLSKDSLPNRYLANVLLATACEVGVQSAVDYIKAMFVKWMKHHEPLPSDMALLILSVGVREGGAEEWDYVWNQTRATSVASQRDMMMESLTHTQKPRLLWRYINWLFDAAKIRQQDVRVVVSHFSKTPLARMVALEFLTSRWDDVVDSFGDVTFLLRDVIQDVTKYVNTPYHLEKLERLFKRQTPKSATKAVGNALALIRANIGWMDANYAKITDWLEKNSAR